jgi:hypothetical protein
LEVRKLVVFVVETYVVKSEKREEFTPALNEFLRYKETHPDLFSGLRSWRLLRQDYGAVAGMYIEMWEFDNLAEMEKHTDRIFADDGMKKISKGFRQLVDPATFSCNIWSPVA